MKHFDPDALTSEEKHRWAWAMEEYCRVLRANSEREVARMSRSDKARILGGEDGGVEERRGRGDENDAEKERVIQALMECYGAQSCPGDPSSALFARLLRGELALPYPPPLAHGQPWYEVVEGDGPWEVCVEALPPANQTILLIEACVWSVAARNAAAGRLLDLQTRFHAEQTVRRVGAAEDSRDQPWGGELGGLREEVERAYQESPEFLVQFGRWPPYWLRMGRHAVVTQRRNVEDAQGNPHTPPWGGASVFALERCWRNPVMGRVIEPAVHPRDRLEAIEQDVREMQILRPEIVQPMVVDARQDLAGDTAKFEAYPRGNEVIGVIIDGWILEKAKRFRPTGS